MAGRADLFVSGVMSLPTDRRPRPRRRRAPRARPAGAVRAVQGRLGRPAVTASPGGQLEEQRVHRGDELAPGRRVRAPGGEIRRQLGQPRTSRRDLGRLLVQTPTVVGVSPAVLPRPADWPAHIDVTGYWFLDTSTAAAPPPGLAAFLASGEPPVYVGFGSMSTHDREGTPRHGPRGAGPRRSPRGRAPRCGQGCSPDDAAGRRPPRRRRAPRLALPAVRRASSTTAAPAPPRPPCGPAYRPESWRTWATSPTGAAGSPSWGSAPRPCAATRLTADRLAAMLDADRIGLAGAGRPRPGAAIRAEDGVGTAVAAIERFSAGDARSRSAR